MKPFLFLSITAIALSVATIPAYAQSNYSQVDSKGGDQMINETRRLETEKPVTVSQASRTTDSQGERMSYIEPAAGRNTNPYDDFTGVYVGGDIGYAIGSYNVNNPLGTDGDVGLDGINGGIFVGYGFEHNFKWLGAYAGIEAGYEWSDADGSIGGDSYEKNHAWLVTFRPGISMHQDTLGYGIIGYSRAEFEGAGGDEDFNGLVLGAGAQFDTNTALKPRLEYTFTNYEDDDIAGVGFDGHENNIKIGAILQF